MVPLFYVLYFYTYTILFRNLILETLFINLPTAPVNIMITQDHMLIDLARSTSKKGPCEGSLYPFTCPHTFAPKNSNKYFLWTLFTCCHVSLQHNLSLDELGTELLLLCLAGLHLPCLPQTILVYFT